MASFQPADKLWSRTFIGLLAAQFLAAFNDQAISTSAMFFCIKTDTLTEAKAITLMMIVYYAPWAVFCTVAGWLADRYSKRDALIGWKVVEVGITLLALVGFWIGRNGFPLAGPLTVVAAVFGMGMHSTFFVPAKYGAMPEIMQAHLLSRGNGVLESLSFLAVILGTVCGGALSTWCDGREWIIGLVLTALAVVGFLASLLIYRMPAANPGRPFPPYVYKPLVANLVQMFRSRPMVLSIIGIAFFTFIVAFMRSTVLMYGESHVPRWTDLETSLVVGMVAVGIGIGSPLVGYLSGGKVEVGLVPIGSICMAVAAGVAAYFVLIGDVSGLIACIILIGLFTGFYLVPLYALLQNRAPKTSKGDWVATSNFVNVTGAIAATGLFYLMFQAAVASGLAPELPTHDVLKGPLVQVIGERDRPQWVEIGGERLPGEDALGIVDRVPTSLKKGEMAEVAAYQLDGRTHYHIRKVGREQKPIYDQRDLPSLLFLSVAFMTLLTFFALRTQLPDLFLRTMLWFRRLGRHGLEVDGMENLPTSGPVILATNADNLDGCLSVLSATDRTTRFILMQTARDKNMSWLARKLAGRDMLAVVRAGKPVDWTEVARKAEEALRKNEVVGLPLDAAYPQDWLDNLLKNSGSAPVLPVRVDAKESASGKVRRFYLLAGESLKPGAEVEEIRRAIEGLADGIKRDEEAKETVGFTPAMGPVASIIATRIESTT